MFDCHIHSLHSPDSQQTIDSVCDQAIALGLEGVAITDHVNALRFEEQDALTRILEQHEDIFQKKERYQGRLVLCGGVEIGEHIHNPKDCEKIVALGWHDVILSSCHVSSVLMQSFAKASFDESVSDEMIRRCVRQHFLDVRRSVEETDLDVVAHLTGPLRYLKRKWNRSIRWETFAEEVERTLEVIIRHGRALEVNTNGYEDEEGYHELPDRALLRLYRSMGGERITIGSDSHGRHPIANRFETTVPMLASLGFEGILAFENRKSRLIPFSAMPIYFPSSEVLP